MALKIKPEPAKDTTKLSVRFPGELAEQIDMYAHLVKSSVNYVVVEAMRAFITADKEFMEAWAAKQAHAAPSPAQAHGQPQGATEAAARKSAAPAA